MSLKIVLLPWAFLPFLACDRSEIEGISHSVRKYHHFRAALPTELTRIFPATLPPNDAPAQVYYRPGGLGSSRLLQLRLNHVSIESLMRVLHECRRKGFIEFRGVNRDPNSRDRIDETMTTYPTDLTGLSPSVIDRDDIVFFAVGNPDQMRVYCSGIVVNTKTQTVRYFAEADRLK